MSVPDTSSPTPKTAPAGQTPPTPGKPAIVFSETMPELLDLLNSTLAITTYQALQLVLLRPGPDRGIRNMDMRCIAFDRPTGIAWEPGRLAIGCSASIWEYRDMPAATSKLTDQTNAGRYDACYLPRHANVTGNMHIHEMCWVARPGALQADGVTRLPSFSELWVANTRFSCLATRGEVHSFIPRWQPPFITDLVAEDRCHLNGMCLRDGVPRYVSILAETDTPSGWRANKQSSGIVMDVTSNQILARGLSMPHSPRWHNGRLWILDSGNGGIGIIDPANGRYQEVARVAGFTRGLDFAGPYAFIGLSLVRESNAFGGIAIAQVPRDQLECGVWVLDIRSGVIVAKVKFTAAVEEVFGVQLMTRLRWPEVNNEDGAVVSATFEVPDVIRK